MTLGFKEQEQQFRREALDISEQNNLKESCKNFKERFIVNILLETGMRIDELCRLSSKEYIEQQKKKLGDNFNKTDYNYINWQDEEIVVYGKKPRQKKGSGEKKLRKIPLSTTAKNWLDKYFNIEENKKVDLYPEMGWHIIKRVTERSGITKKTTPHVLRHTFAVNWIRNGGSLPSLKRILGHTSLQTTGIYLTMTSTDLKDEMKKVQG